VTTSLAALRGSSREVYDSRWQAYVDWCSSNELQHPESLAPQKVLDFLQSKSHCQPKTLTGYVTAISNRHEKIDGLKLSSFPPVQAWLKGFAKTKGITRVMVPPWNLDVVLAGLKKPPFEPLGKVPLKYVTLKTAFLVAITSSRRVSEIHALRADYGYLTMNVNEVVLFPGLEFVPKVDSAFHSNQPLVLPCLSKDSDPSLRTLCVKRALSFYLKSTKEYRSKEGANPLFLAYGLEKRGQAISKQRISEWLKLTISLAYANMGASPPQGVKAHQVRKAATSWADMAGVDPQLICNAATWSSDSMFARYYHLDIVHGHRSTFGRQVLKLAGSSNADAAVRRALGGTQPGTGLSKGYRIPMLNKQSD